MLGVPGVMGSSVDGGSAAEHPHETGGASGGSSDVGGGPISLLALEETEKGGGGGGNRWPKQETLALIQIRHEMDSAFRDSSFKGPLWEDVSRKMEELGFQRNPKKCKEKFENVFKYHKRTKDGRSSKPDGKTYRFFKQLEALENTPPPPPPPPQSTAAHFTTTTAANYTYPPILPPPTSLSPTPISFIPPQITSNPQLNSTSSSTSSDEGIHRRRRRRRGKNKRKWKDYFEGLTRDIIVRQEEMQKRFLEALQRRELDRTAREESWRAQHTARINRELELLSQERQKAAAKNSAVIAFLQKVSELPANFTAATTVLLPPPPPTTKTAAEDDNAPSSSSSRWPKAEVQALIDLRTRFDLKYQDNGPKGPLWEEISAAMGELGYSRNARRCKEKWENINKYYKKVKESDNKKRAEDSKTCPYFHQLEAIYRARNNSESAQISYGAARPKQQQWPVLLPQELQQQKEAVNDEDMEHDDVDGGDEDGQGGGGYEVLGEPSNKQTRTSVIE